LIKIHELKQTWIEIMETQRRHKKALVVDDMPWMRMVIRSLLNHIGDIDTVEAADGHEALKYLSVCHVDILICDWNMPGMTGLDVLKAVRQELQLHDLPVLMVTAEYSQRQVADAIKAGVTAYISKPFTLSVLQAHILECLAKNKR
jgi:two-component system chemotaxis response regulator CheY